jgi:predicted ArsR family transcriptional regulator
MSEDRPVDVNERVTEAWKTDTGPGERVRTVMKRTYDPQPVATIAGRALTSETTARKHLTVLAEDGFVEAVSPPDQRRTWYKRASLSCSRTRSANAGRRRHRDAVGARHKASRDRPRVRRPSESR